MVRAQGQRAVQGIILTPSLYAPIRVSVRFKAGQLDQENKQLRERVRRLCAAPIRPPLWPIMNNHITVGS